MGLGQGPHWQQLPQGLRDARRPSACSHSLQLGWHAGRLTDTTSLKVCFIHFMRRDGLVPLPGAASACWGGDHSPAAPPRLQASFTHRAPSQPHNQPVSPTPRQRGPHMSIRHLGAQGGP